jgi:hypothetical protein
MDFKWSMLSAWQESQLAVCGDPNGDGLSLWISGRMRGRYISSTKVCPCWRRLCWQTPRPRSGLSLPQPSSNSRAARLTCGEPAAANASPWR